MTEHWVWIVDKEDYTYGGMDIMKIDRQPKMVYDGEMATGVDRGRLPDVWEVFNSTVQYIGERMGAKWPGGISVMVIPWRGAQCRR